MIPNKDLLELEKKSNSNINKGLPEVSPFLITPQQPPKTKPNFYKIEENSILSRVKDFLPKLKEANIDLKKKIENKEDVNIENIKDGEEYIQMNLALGILEHKEELSENNIKITSNNNSNNNNNNNCNNNSNNSGGNKPSKPIVEINKEKENENNKKRKEPNTNTSCTDITNKNNNLDEQINFNPENSKNILDIINTPPSVIDKFGLILDNSDEDEDFENQEKLEPLEINY
ncbi:hypothetical protein RB653_002913 [Dictyostelium firmibasis]|uniref:Uncharacterized protein n=1 Tax=Dictyostelium firmibasis TaxID=79012 RepID=A0AAN7U3P5_9MYCE